MTGVSFCMFVMLQKGLFKLKEIKLVLKGGNFSFKFELRA